MSDNPEATLVTELRELAGSEAQGRSRFVVRRGRLEIEVEYSDGSSSSLALLATYTSVARRDHPALLEREQRDYRRTQAGPLRARRPMAIELRREDLVDRRAKADGLSVEWQSGDEDFDRAVYVCSRTSDAEVLAAVVCDEVRKGVLELLALGFRRVSIDDDGRICAHLTEFVAPRSAAQQNRGLLVIQAFVRILSNVPAIESSLEEAPAVPFAGWTRLLRIIGILGWATNVPITAAFLHLLRSVAGLPEDVPSFLQIALVFALAVGLGMFGATGYGALVRPRLQGRSDAHHILSSAKFSAFGGLSVVCFFVFLTVLVFVASRP